MKSITLGVIVTILFGTLGITALDEPEPKPAGTYNAFIIFYE